jgi:hypothetical protein
MTLEHDLLQIARDALRSLMSGRDFAVGQTGHYLNIISRIEAELNRPQPKQEFYPDWDMLQPYHERIKELEKELAKFAPVGEIRSSVWAGHNWAHHFNAQAKLDLKTKLYIKLEHEHE